MERYQHQLKLENFGKEGQKALQKGKVLVVGAGGIGCSALQTLTAMGVGMLGIADDDRIEISNLPRQILYTPDDLDKPKALVAKERLQKQNPGCLFRLYDRITVENAASIFADYQIVLDASDNFPTRYLINDTCVKLNLPFISGAVEKYSGQLATFNWKGSPTYRDLFPTPSSCQNCTATGVLGVIANLIGQLQALEAIKLLTGIECPLTGKLLCFDGNAFKTVSYAKNFSPLVKLISFSQLKTLNSPQLVDVRRAKERGSFHIGGIHLPKLKNLEQLDPSRPIVVYCQKGVRSLIAAHKIHKKIQPIEIYSLEGGIEQAINQK